MLIFQIYITFIFIISIIKGESCPKDKPIYKEGECRLTYCTDDEFNDGTCEIANEIIYTQWLNYRHILGEKNCRYFCLARSFSNELIFESSYEGNDLLSKERFFYGYNEGGRQLFYDKYEEENTYTKTLLIEDGNIQKHFSEIAFFNYFNSDNKKNKILSVGDFFEIYDYDGFDGEIAVGNSEKKLGSKIFSDRNALLELNNQSNSYVYAFNNESNFIITKFYFNSSDIEKGYFQLNKVSKTIFGTKMISCYEGNLYIVCLYRNQNSKYELSLYNTETLTQISNSYILNDQVIIDSYTLFFKAIYLKNNVGIFGYYKNNSDQNPIIELDNIVVSNSRQYTISPYNEYYNNKTRYILDHYKLDNNYNKNDIAKITDTRFSWVSTTIEKELVIIIFDLYNDDKNLLIKYYKIPTLKLYNFVVVDNIRGYSLMDTLGIGYTVLDYSTNEIFTNFMNFGFSENEDQVYDLNIYPYERCIYFTFYNVTTNSISNNIFGFDPIGVKLLSAPYPSSSANARFYYNSSDVKNYTFIQTNHIIDMNKYIRVETWGDSRDNKIIYQVLYKEVERFEDIYNYTDYMEFYGEDPKNFYEPNYYEGKKEIMTFTLNIKGFDRSQATFCGIENPPPQQHSNGGVSISVGRTGSCCSGGSSSSSGYSGSSGNSHSSSSSTNEGCRENCYECVSKGDDNTQKCTICKSGMGIKEDEYNPTEGNNCYEPKIETYFFDNSVPFEYRFRKCYPTCKYCSGYGNETNHSCLVCLENYYEKEEDLSLDLRNCYKNPQPGYALSEGKNQKFVQCDSTCSNCTKPKDLISTYCNGCNTSLGYYELDDNKQKCVQNISRYVLREDPVDGIIRWLKCADGCEVCDNRYDNETDDMHCVTCRNDQINKYYFKNNSNNCYREAPDHFYPKKENGVIKYFQCSENCFNCQNNPDYCTSCNKTGNGILNEREHFCIYTCENSDEYYDYTKRKCTTECSGRYYYKDPLTKTCVNCKDIKKYLLIESGTQRCVDNIQEGYYFNYKATNREEYLFNVLEPCYNTCQTCSEGSTNSNNQKCIKCKNNYYLVEGTHNCEEKCNPDSTIDKYYVKENGVCVNCHKNTNGQIYKFIDEDKCISKTDADNIKNKYRIVDANRGILEKCHEECLKCSGFSNDNNNMKCISCKNKYYLREGTSNCYSKPPSGTFLNSNRKLYQNCNTNCVNCKERADKCTECNETDSLFLENDKCVRRCPPGKFVLEGYCYDACPNYYYGNSTERKCVNCKEKNLYIDLDNNSSCINKSENYIDIPEYAKYGGIRKCFERCKTCSAVSNDVNDQKCLTCTSQYYLRYESGNCMPTCDDSHDNYFIKNSNKCINCKKESIKNRNNKEYKYINSNTECLDKSTVLQLYGNFYYIDTNTGTIDICHPNCLTCESKSTNNNNMLCLSCDNNKGYYMVEGTKNCQNYPPQNHFLDKKNNIYSPCYSTCLTCDRKGDENNHHCLQCKSDLYKYKNGEKCLNLCNGTDYPQSYNSYPEGFCLSSKCKYKDIYNYERTLYYDSINEKCVDSCPSNIYKFQQLPLCVESCAAILEYKDFVKENYSDYYSFYDAYYLPADEFFYSKNYYYCEPYCRYNKQYNQILYCNSDFGEIIRNSINSNLSNLEKIIKTKKIFNLNDYYAYYDYNIMSKYEFFRFNFSEINETTIIKSNVDVISDINLEDCFKNKISKELIDPYRSLIVYKIDKESGEYLSNYITYNILLDDGTSLDYLCDYKTTFIINSPINQKLKKRIEMIREVNESQSINLFDPDEKIFHDICEPFSYNGVDINMYLRINYFYQNQSLCQDNCYYNGIKFDELKVVCICPQDYITIEKYKNEREMKTSQLTKNNPNIDKYNNIKILKCHKVFFKYPANFGFIIYILISAASIFSIIFFYIKDYNPTRYKEDLEILYELKTEIKEEKILIERPKPQNEKKEKEKKPKFKLIIGLLTNNNNNQNDIKNSKKENSSYNDSESKTEEKNKTIIYEKDMFDTNNLDKTESKEKLIKEEQYKIVRKEISEYHLIESKYNNFINKKKIDKNCISYLKIFLNNYPITKIFFMKKEYQLMSPKMWYEKLSLNLLFYLGLFSLLISINCIYFNDDLITMRYEDIDHLLYFFDYYINSFLAGAIYIVLGIIFSLIFIYGIQAFHPGEVYDTKIFRSKINGKVKSYLIGVIAFQVIEMLFIIFGWYYSSIFCNIYNKTQKYLIIQIIISLVTELIFYFIVSAFIYLCKK